MLLFFPQSTSDPLLLKSKGMIGQSATLIGYITHPKRSSSSFSTLLQLHARVHSSKYLYLLSFSGMMPHCKGEQKFQRGVVYFKGGLDISKGREKFQRGEEYFKGERNISKGEEYFKWERNISKGRGIFRRGEEYFKGERNIS